MKELKSPQIVGAKRANQFDLPTYSTKCRTNRKPADELELTKASHIKPQPIDWIWDGWLAMGKLHILGGSPGTGKTTISLALAATLSSGGIWPDGSNCDSGNVVIWSGEDDAKDTLVPRLMKAGANTDRIYFVTGIIDRDVKRPFSPASDIDLLKQKIKEVGDVKLVIIDPIVSAISGDSHKNAEVRSALQPLVDMAALMNFALLGITHFSKGTKGRDPLERITGSLAFGAVARIVMVVGKKTENGSDTRIFIRAKSNIGFDGGGFQYEIQHSELDNYSDVIASYVIWGESISGSALELLNNTESLNEKTGESKLELAKLFLREVLTNGSVLQSYIEAKAKENGHSVSTLRRAKERLSIIAFQDPKKIGQGGVPWQWKLPEY